MFNNHNIILEMAVCVASSLAIMSGIAESWTSPMLPKLENNKMLHQDCYKRPITTSGEALVVSMLQLGSAFGCIASIYTSVNIGKKKTVILFSTLSLASYLLSGFGKNIRYVYCARFLSGFGSSCCLTVIPQYINELVDKERKQSPYSLMGVFLALGILFSFMFGPYSDVREFSFICLVAVGLMLTIFNICVPETPQFLASMGDKNKAERCLRKLRSHLDDISIQKEMMKLFKETSDQKDTKFKFSSIYTLKMSPKPFVICIGLLCFQELSGISIILSYMQKIFGETSPVAPEVSSAIIGASKLISAILISSILGKVSKKNLLLISSIGSCISLALLGGYFFVKRNNFEILQDLQWLPIISLICYMFSFNTGFEYVAWAISTKIFQPEADLFASSTAHATSKFVSFFLTLSFPYVSEKLGLDFCFWTLASFCALAVIFVIIFIRQEIVEEPSNSKTDLCEQTQVPP